jgi:hypothetical protein
LSNLSDAEYGRLVKAILAFAMGKECAPRLSRAGNMAYRMITASIARAEGRRFGTQPQKMENKCEKEQKAFKRIESQIPTQSEICCEKEDIPPTECAKSEDTEANCSTNQKTPLPTKDEVRNFFKSRGFKSDPDEFFNFYESNGWKVGQNAMANWHASAENWEIRLNRERSPTKAAEEPQRYGDFDVNEAFRLALERSARWDDDDD